MAHEKDTATVWLLKVLGGGGGGDVVEVETRSLIRHAELKNGPLRSHFDVDHLAGIQFVAVNNRIVDRCGHCDEEFPVMGLLDSEFLTEPINEPFDFGDAFHAGGNLQFSHFGHAVDSLLVRDFQSIEIIVDAELVVGGEVRGDGSEQLDFVGLFPLVFL